MTSAPPRQEVLPPEAPDHRRRWRSDGWSPRKIERFLEVLTQCGSLRDSARVVGLSTTSVYRLRDADRRFGLRMAAALEAIRPSVIEAAYQRAVIGWDEPVFHGGQQVGVRRRHSDALLRMLLQRGIDPSNALPPEGDEVPVATDGEVTDALDLRLARLAAGVALKARDDQLAWAARMQALGWAP